MALDYARLPRSEGNSDVRGRREGGRSCRWVEWRHNRSGEDVVFVDQEE